MMVAQKRRKFSGKALAADVALLTVPRLRIPVWLVTGSGVTPISCRNEGT